MSRTEAIDSLKLHIRELSIEINGLKKQINPFMSQKEYSEVHAKFLNLSNLKAIAQNELASNLHYYKVTLRGKKKTQGELPSEKIFRRKLISEIDYKPYASKAYDFSDDAGSKIYRYIQQSYSNFFADGEFSVQKIVQIR